MNNDLSGCPIIPRAAVSAAIFREGKVLLEAIRRQLWEETAVAMKSPEARTWIAGEANTHLATVAILPHKYGPQFKVAEIGL